MPRKKRISKEKRVELHRLADQYVEARKADLNIGVALQLNCYLRAVESITGGW
jgi:hypothetical protein